MEKVSIIKNLISLVNLTSDEVQALVRELIAGYGLNAADCAKKSEHDVDNEPVSSVASEAFATASGKTSEQQVKTAKKRGRPKKVKAEDTVSETVREIPDKKRGRLQKVKTGGPGSETVQEIPTKKRGRSKKVKAEDTVSETVRETPSKKRGRPKKVKAEVIATEGADSNSEQKALAEAAKIEAALKSENNKKGGVTRTFKLLSDCAELREQAFGSEQPFAFLYKWNGHNVLSNYVLSEMMPLGIYIPYKNLMFGKYRGFVVSLYDEKVITDAGEAFDEAERAFEAIDGERWSVMNSLQWGVLKNVQDIVSHMFRKVGGDGLRGAYKTVSPRSKNICGIGKFRYTVDVK